MHEVLVNRLGGLSLPRKSVVRLTDRPDMTLDVYRGRKTTMQQQQQTGAFHVFTFFGEWIYACLIQVACLIEMATKTGFTVLLKEEIYPWGSWPPL